MSPAPPNASDIVRALRGAGSPRHAAVLQRFFKTGPGEYGEGDVFLGVRVPAVRKLAARYRDAPLTTVRALLRSPIHEVRLLALLLLVRRFEREGEPERERIYRLYLAHTRWINNWDLVDLSAPNIVGTHLLARSRGPLYRLARSHSLWERRIAVLATLAFIRQGQFADALDIADRLLRDREDLVQKAVGWMLREVGKRDRAAEEAFLRPRCRAMPRTMLRYAIERFPPAARRRYL
jgi:3-methyladenine DNA glycosylase AlkD